MGFMKIIEAAVKATVALPISAAKDVVNAYEIIIEDEKSSVAETIDSIFEDIDEIGD